MVFSCIYYLWCPFGEGNCLLICESVMRGHKCLSCSVLIYILSPHLIHSTLPITLLFNYFYLFIVQRSIARHGSIQVLLLSLRKFLDLHLAWMLLFNNLRNNSNLETPLLREGWKKTASNISSLGMSQRTSVQFLSTHI